MSIGNGFTISGNVNPHGLSAAVVTRRLSGIFKKLVLSFALLLMSGMSVIPLVAQAQNVLILSTDEGDNNPFELAAVLDEFEAAGATINHQMILGIENAVTPSTFSQSPGPYDIVVIASVYEPIDSSNWDAVNEAVESRRSNAFLFFIDGCSSCSTTQNAQQLVTSINSTAGLSVSLGNNVQQSLQMPLNTASPYASSFTGLNPFRVGFITYINGVPRDNALYLAPDSAIPPVDPLLDDVFGLLIPRSESYGGNGACIFATVDMTLFMETNDRQIAPAFIHAATSPDGACGTPAEVSKSFSTSQVSQWPAGANSTLLTITVNNFTDTNLEHIQLTDNLPAPLRIASLPSTTCLGGTLAGNIGSGAISLSDFAVPANEACSITVQVLWPSTATCENTTITNIITPGSDFVTPMGQIFTPAVASLTCIASSAPITTAAQAVPLNRSWVLFVLACIVVGVGLVSRARYH